MFFYHRIRQHGLHYTGTIDAESKVYVRFLREHSDLTVQEIVDLCGISRSSIYRCLNAKKCEKERQLRGRPRLISPRDERIIVRNIARLHKEEGNFPCHQLRAESGLHHVSLWTMNRTLKRLGFNLHRRKKKMSTCDRFRVMSLAPRRKRPRNVVQMK